MFTHLDCLIAVKNNDLKKIIDLLLDLENNNNLYGYKAFLFNFLIENSDAEHALLALQKLQYPPVTQLVKIILLSGTSEHIFALRTYQKNLINKEK